MQKLIGIKCKFIAGTTRVSNSKCKHLFQFIGRQLIAITFITMPTLADQSGAFIKDGEVWLKKNSKSEVQLTFTKKNIVKLEISPSGKFAAAHKIIGHYEQETDIENDTSYTLENIYSVLILDLKTGKVIEDVNKEKAFIRPSGWQPDESYLYGQGSPLDTTNEFRYDPKTGKTQNKKK